MIQFRSTVLKFGRKGEKTGWNYVEIDSELANKIKKDTKTSFRVKGKIDAMEVSGLALLPMGDGNFIIPINTKMLKTLKKVKGDVLDFSLEADVDFKIEMPIDLEDALARDEKLLEQFYSFNKSNRNYFIKYIDAAKTETTRNKRIGLTVEAMYKKYDFGKMIREEKKNRLA